jgi:hypothetical protein
MKATQNKNVNTSTAPPNKKKVPPTFLSRDGLVNGRVRGRNVGGTFFYFGWTFSILFTSATWASSSVIISRAYSSRNTDLPSTSFNNV